MNEEINQSYFDIEFENNDQICIGKKRQGVELDSENEEHSGAPSEPRSADNYEPSSNM